MEGKLLIKYIRIEHNIHEYVNSNSFSKPCEINSNYLKKQFENSKFINPYIQLVCKYHNNSQIRVLQPTPDCWILKSYKQYRRFKGSPKRNQKSRAIKLTWLVEYWVSNLNCKSTYALHVLKSKKYFFYRRFLYVFLRSPYNTLWKLLSFIVLLFLGLFDTSVDGISRSSAGIELKGKSLFLCKVWATFSDKLLTLKTGISKFDILWIVYTSESNWSANLCFL